MPFFQDVHILPSGKTHRFNGASDTNYLFVEDQATPVQKTPVWCRHCQDVTEGEFIESLEELDALIVAYGNPDSTQYRQFKEWIDAGPKWNTDCAEMVRIFREAAIHRRRWRVLRISPPKCFACGQTDILILPCPGKAEVDGHVISVRQHVHWSGDWRTRYLNVEGEPLELAFDCPAEEQEERPSKRWWQFWR